MPVQKQTRAGQRTRFKAFVAIGDFDGHVGLGVKCAKEVATAIRGAIILAKLSVIPVRRGYWGNKLGEPHTVPCKVDGKVGSVYVGLIPAPRGTGIVAAPASKRMLQLAGVEDCYTCSRGVSLSPFCLPRPFGFGCRLWPSFLVLRSLLTSNRVRIRARWVTSSRLPTPPSPRYVPFWCQPRALADLSCPSQTYGFLTPDLWTKIEPSAQPYEEFSAASDLPLSLNFR